MFLKMWLQVILKTAFMKLKSQFTDLGPYPNDLKISWKDSPVLADRFSFWNRLNIVNTSQVIYFLENLVKSKKFYGSKIFPGPGFDNFPSGNGSLSSSFRFSKWDYSKVNDIFLVKWVKNKTFYGTKLFTKLWNGFFLSNKSHHHFKFFKLEYSLIQCQHTL